MVLTHVDLIEKLLHYNRERLYLSNLLLIKTIHSHGEIQGQGCKLLDLVQNCIISSKYTWFTRRNWIFAEHAKRL